MGRKRKRSPCRLDAQDARKKKIRLDQICAGAENLVGRRLLPYYCPHVSTLGQYLLQITGPQSSFNQAVLGLAEEDGALKLLQNVLVGSYKLPNARERALRVRDFQDFSQRCNSAGSDDRRTSGGFQSSLGDGSAILSELVDFAIWTLFFRTHRNVQRPPHILCNGFLRANGSTKSNGSSAYNSSIEGLTVQSANAQVERIKSDDWARLLRMLGTDGDFVFLDLLVECAIFAPIENGMDNFLQLSGTNLAELSPLAEVKRASSKMHTSVGPRPKQASLPSPRPTSQIAFVRSRMFYARAALNGKGEVHFGMRHIHVLNRFPDHNDQQHTVHCMKYIFPRQFGLHNAFTSTVDKRETSHSFKDYTLREAEIETGGCLRNATSLPKRLRGECFKLVSSLQKLHRQCAYKELLKHYCPVDELDKPSKRRKKRSNGETLLGTQVPSTGEFLTDGEDGRKKELVDLSTSVADVSAFTRAVVRRIIPRSFFKSTERDDANWECLERSVDHFIRCKRFENLTLDSVCQGIKVKSVEWLRPPKVAAQGNISKADHAKRLELMQELIYYIFDSIVIPLIRSNFHVTESSDHRNRLFFFRHDVWRLVTEPAMTRIKTNIYKEISTATAKKILDSRTLGYANLRLLPKKQTARPIVNLKRRAVIQKNGKTFLGPGINSTLKNAFSMLNYEKLAQPLLTGSAMFSVNELYPRLLSFKKSLTSSGLSDTNLYFVKVDVQSCFDTIPQEALFQLVDKLCQRESFTIKHHTQVKSAANNGGNYVTRPQQEKPSKKFLALAHAQNHSQDATFSELVENQYSLGKKGTVFVEGAKQNKVDPEDLLDMLSDHIKQNIVRIGKKYFWQKTGIAQGSLVSSLLCSFFYGDFEAKRLSFLGSTNTGRRSQRALFRLIDDFLLITTDRQEAEKFLQIMLAGDPEYGISVKPQKTVINFAPASSVSKSPLTIVAPTVPFPWCGTWIDQKSLALTRDRSKNYESQLEGPECSQGRATEMHRLVDFADVVTTEISRRPGVAFHRKTMSSIRLNVRKMYTDTNFVSADQVRQELQCGFVEVADKTVRYLARLRDMTSHGDVNEQCVKRTIKAAARLAIMLTRGRQKGKPNQDSYQCEVSPSDIELLLVRAFAEKFQKQQTRYKSTLHWLRDQENSIKTIGGYQR